MTMHMLPSYFTTTSTRKRKSKKKTESIIEEEIKTQKLLERLGYNKNHNFRHDIPNYRISKSDVKTSDAVGNGFKNMRKQYTGDELAGIGTLHKSNMVPVRKDSDDAKEIARMRRGWKILSQNI